MNEWHKVAIVGVGLIGGSIGLALRRRKLARQVVGVVRRPASLSQVTELGAVGSATLDLAEAVSDADLVVVCTPPDCIAEHVEKVASACGSQTLITDAGSTKASIVGRLDGALRGARFVGSHPLAGSEKTGAEHATADLFDGRIVVVTPTQNTSPSDINEVCRFWSALGAVTIQMSPAEHDRAVAATSHVPHLVAFALAAATRSEDLPLTASGWRDTTRIAASDPQLWRQIALDNRQNILAALEHFETQLDSLKKALEAGDGAELEKLLVQGKAIRDAAQDHRSAQRGPG